MRIETHQNIMLLGPAVHPVVREALDGASTTVLPSERRECDAFEEMRRVYFPRWARGKEWRVVVGSYTGSRYEMAFCVPEQRTIYISPAIANGDPTALSATLIHETCHAVSDLGHRAVFLRRLRTAADRARALGDSALADALAADADRTGSLRPMRANDVYDLVRDYVRQVPEGAFEDMLEGVGERLGLRPAELADRYTRAGREFEAAREGATVKRRGSGPDNAGATPRVASIANLPDVARVEGRPHVPAEALDVARC